MPLAHRAIGHLTGQTAQDLAARRETFPARGRPSLGSPDPVKFGCGGVVRRREAHARASLPQQFHVTSASVVSYVCLVFVSDQAQLQPSC